MSNDKAPKIGPLFATAQLAASQNKDALEDYKKMDVFWDVASVTTLTANWNKMFPYQLLVMERVDGNWSITTNKDVPTARFTLPIAPQSIDIDMSFAMQVEATQGGVIEQANGSPFRDIVLQGTTGVFPLRNVSAPVQSPNTAIDLLTRGIFAGTVSAVQVAQSLDRRTVIPNVAPEASFEAGGDLAMGTGYVQFLLLKRFLEWYSNFKKTTAGRNMTLGLAIWKENEVYLVTPQKFRVSRNSSAALSYNYTLALKAWRRVVVMSGNVGAQIDHSFVGRDANAYTEVLNKIDTARRLLENGRKILGAVRADVNNAVFGNLRRMSLFLKDVLGTTLAVVDFPISMFNDFKTGFLEKVPQLVAGLGQDLIAIGRKADSYAGYKPNPNVKQLKQELESLANASQKSKTGSGSNSSDQQQLSNNKGSSPALRLFTNPEDYYDFWSSISIDDINIRPEAVFKIEQERASVRNLQRQDFEQIRDQLASVLADFEAAVGVGNSAYSTAFGSQRPATKIAPNDADWEIIFALGESIRQMDAMAASSSINRTNVEAVDVVAGLARRSGIAFNVPTSKFLVPVPYGLTIEQIAQRYLDSPDRWIELATLNGLKTPYIDETGLTQDFLTNGSGNKFSVTDGARHYVGQSIWISAIGVKREKRRITRLEVQSPTLTIVTVDGAPDLERFKVNLEAFVHSFLPETTNSLQFMYIPSTEQAETDWLTKSIPGVDSFDPLFRVGGVDLLIDDSGDLVITQDGTTRLAVGLTNLIQRVRIGVATPQGSLFRHPEFGFGVISGTSTADVSASSILEAAKSFIRNEKGFAGISYAAVSKNGYGLRISLAVEIAGVNKVVPISVDLK